MLARLRSLAPSSCPAAALLDRSLLAWGAAWTIAAFLAYGLVAAIIPIPVFGRSVPPTTSAIWVWVLSAPLMGLVMATWTAPMRLAPAVATPLSRQVRLPSPAPMDAGRGGALGMVGSLGAFLAIGCPVCNKIALLLLGTSGALSVWAPLQPVVGAASLVLLAVTLVWRLRIRALGGACPA